MLVLGITDLIVLITGNHKQRLSDILFNIQVIDINELLNLRSNLKN